MKKIVVLFSAALLPTALWAADSAQTVVNAAKHMSEKPNYSWATSMKEGDGSPGKLGTIEGKGDKTGITFLSFTIGGLAVEVCMKGGKGSAKALEGWQSFDDIAQTSGTAAAVVKYLRSYKAPASESADLAGKTKELKEEDGVVSGDLTADAAKELLLAAARRREGDEAAKATDPKGSIKYWIKDGALTKYEIKIQGKVTAGDRESDINRTTTVEIKEVGTTKIDVAPDALQKMS
jgi:hypothetical protein